MATDTISTVDYGMLQYWLDRCVHEAVLEQIKIIQARAVNASHYMHDDITAVHNRARKIAQVPRLTFGSDTVSLVREALTRGMAQPEDAPLPKGEVEYGIMSVRQSDGRTESMGFWVDDAEVRDKHLGHLLDGMAGAKTDYTYVGIRKITEYERG